MLKFHANELMRLSLIYIVLGAILTCVIHPRGADYMIAMFQSPQLHLQNLVANMPLICLGVLTMGLVTRAFLDKNRMIEVGIVFAANIFFMGGFSMFKSLMPFINPFWADPLLADIDRALHFGVDPWRLVEPLRPIIGTWAIDFFYLKFWAWAGVAGPVLLVLFDRDRVRVSRFLVLYCFAWIFLGNILAMAFMSGGPVYMDRLFGIDAFVELTALLQAEADRASLMGRMREWLWAVNQDSYRGISSGISAFPSLHVAIAALTLFYCIERSVYLILPGFVFFAFIQIVSVLSGLHYAIDGYVAFAVLGLFWIYLRRAAARSQDFRAGDPQSQIV